jgi:uncharacterized damage-inducible protein DinB
LAALADVDVRLATARPAAAVHNISELVVHMTSWTREIVRRLHTGVAQDPVDGDWPRADVTTDAQWHAVVAAFVAANEELRAAIATLDESRLDEHIGDTREPSLGSGVSRYVTLHGLSQHHAYHAGQIAMLKRLATSPASSRQT